MAKKKFSTLESKDGEEYGGPVEYVLGNEDMVVPDTVLTGATLTIATGESLVVKRRFKVAGTGKLKIEGTGRLGVV